MRYICGWIDRFTIFVREASILSDFTSENFWYLIEY